MHRFFVDSSAINDNTIIISGTDAHHISKVLRIREDDEIIVCDQCGTDYVCSVAEIDSEKVVARIFRKSASISEPPVNITLYQGVPKGDKLETVIQKCVELGAIKVVPVSMKRCVAIIKDKDKAKKHERMQRIAFEAAKQCGRSVIPEVSEVMSFENAINEASGKCDLKLLPYEGEKNNSIKTVLKNNQDAKNICIFIGPEGGFDDSEIKYALNHGFSIVTLGPRILRTETAPLAAISAVLYELGDW